MNKIILSKQKVISLRKELKILNKSLKEKRIEQAQRGGLLDSWHETASFAATDGTIEQKVQKLELIIKKALILPEVIHSNTIVIGSRIMLQSDKGKFKKYRLVHPLEVDPEKRLLSVESPLGKSLLGKKVGDLIKFNDMSYKITRS